MGEGKTAVIVPMVITALADPICWWLVQHEQGRLPLGPLHVFGSLFCRAVLDKVLTITEGRDDAARLERDARTK